MPFLIKQLIERNLLAADAAVAVEEELKASPNKTEEELLMSKGLIGEEDLFKIKGEILGMPFISAMPEEMSLEILKTIPEETARFYWMIPISEKKGEVMIGMVYPDDLKAQEALKFLAREHQFTYQVVLITPKIFSLMMGKYRDLKKEVGKALEEFQEEESEVDAAQGVKLDLVSNVEDAPIAKIVNVVIRNAIDGKASDIHIEPSRTKLRVRFRVMGELYSSIFLPLNIANAVLARIKIISNMKIDENRVPQDGRFSLKIDNKSIDFRVSTLPTAMGEKVVMRILDPDVGFKTFEDLGLDGRNLELVKKAVDEPFGLVLVTGPTGSGKSTTLYAVLQTINDDKINIISLEDPVEYFCEGVNQSQVKPEIGFDFASGLRSILRQDPDVIMVGEVRDEETAMLTIHSALTGHLVLSTLHTNDSLGVIPRLVDLKIQSYLIPSTLTLALAQRLVRRLCPHCKKQVEATGYLKERIIAEFNNIPEQSRNGVKLTEPIMVWEPVGCPKCGRQGFIGRVGIFETLEMTPELGEIILQDLSEMKLAAEGRRQGMTTMRQDGVLKALRGMTTVEEILKATEEDITVAITDVDKKKE